MLHIPLYYLHSRKYFLLSLKLLLILTVRDEVVMHPGANWTTCVSLNELILSWKENAFVLGEIIKLIYAWTSIFF